MIVEVKKLSYRAGKKIILDGVCAVFEGNQIYGIIGPNGCGKTTLLRHLYRSLSSKGRIFLDEKDVCTYGRREFAQKVAVMMQYQDFAEEGLLVRDVVQTGRFPYKKVLSQYDKKDERAIADSLKRTGLSEMEFRQIRTLSGGELQRVMIAKCLAQEPEVIVLDEPTNHLDIKYKLELMNLLKTFSGLVIMTIHDLNLAAKYCDYLYVMNEGRILNQGLPRKVLSEEMLEKTFHVRLPVIQCGKEIYIGA